MKNPFPKSTSGPHPAFAPWLTALFLLLITAAVYSLVRHHEFINFDDGGYVYENEHIQKGLTPDSIKWAFTLVKSDEKSYWHPVTWLSHMLDCQLFGIDPGYHHLSNLFYHLVNVLLLFLLLLRMTGAVWKSAAVAALFALHPVNVDSVAWIAERKNLLSTTFWMLTMLAYVRYAARPSAWRYLVTMLVFTIGLMAKPMLVTLPCALLLLDFWPLFRFKWFNECWLDREALPTADHPTFHGVSVKRLIIEKIPFLLLSVGAIWLSVISLRSYSQIRNAIEIPFSLRIENALVSYIHYLWQLIWPAKLAIFYPFPTSIPLWQTITATIAFIGITLLVIVHSRRKPYLATGWFWYLGTLTPVIGIIQGGLWPQIADRWAYVPFIGIFLLLTWASGDMILRLRAKRIIGSGVMISILVIMAVLTIRQLGYWNNTYMLFQHALDVTQNNYYAHVSVGKEFSTKGDHQQAMAHFQESLNILPSYSLALEALGEEHAFLKEFEKALTYYEKALFNDPSNAFLCNKTGNLYTEIGEYKQAIRYYKDAIAIEPENPHAYNNLGIAYYYSGQMEPAAENIQKSLALKPDYAEAHYNLGLVINKTSDIANAITHFQKAVKFNPDYAEAHNSLGKIFFQAGNLTAALASFREVVRISPKDAPAHYNIGAILYTQQRLPEAARCFQKALEIDPGYDKARAALKLIGK